MEREIKFRVWRPAIKEMQIVTQIIWGSLVGYGKISHISTGQNDLAPDKVILMQFTNRKDKNGKEIYEGDIIEFDKKEWGGDDNIHIVSWNNDDSEWCFGGGTARDMEYRTVIGNIYEHSALIKK